MRPNLKQQFINHLVSSDETFKATFRNSAHLTLKQSILFERVLDVWSADVEHKNLRFNVGKITKTSIHLYSYVAGCKVSVVLPLDLLLYIQPIHEQPA
ncbi:hypothetical protein [Spirosoma litoris]